MQGLGDRPLFHEIAHKLHRRILKRLPRAGYSDFAIGSIPVGVSKGLSLKSEESPYFMRFAWF